MTAKTTKTLAKKLGFISFLNNEKPTSTTTQTYAYLIVIDFESTCWKPIEKQIKNQPEIIEFSSVLLNTQTGLIEETFQQYVFPLENPKLSDFCIEFTKITQQVVDNGVPLWTCLSLFNKWLNQITIKKQNLHFALVTWTDWDLGICLDKECKRKGIIKSQLLNRWIDLKYLYKLFYSRRPKGLNGALNDVGLRFHGQQHCGLDDARNTAQLAVKMMRDGCVMELTTFL